MLAAAGTGQKQGGRIKATAWVSQKITSRFTEGCSNSCCFEDCLAFWINLHIRHGCWPSKVCVTAVRMDEDRE